MARKKEIDRQTDKQAAAAGKGEKEKRKEEENKTERLES